MKPIQAINQLVKVTVKSKRYASRLMGRTDCFLSNLTSRNRDCRVSLLAHLADTVGWSLVLVSPECTIVGGDHIRIEPNVNTD